MDAKQDISPKTIALHETIEVTPSDLMTVREAAAYLRISIWTLRHWVSKRKIRYIKLGRAVRFRKSHLDRFITEHVHGKEIRKDDAV